LMKEEEDLVLEEVEGVEQEWGECNISFNSLINNFIIFLKCIFVDLV